MSFPEQAVQPVQQPTSAAQSAQQVSSTPVQPAETQQRAAPTWQTSSQTPQPLPTRDATQPLSLPLGTFANSVSRSPVPPAASPLPASNAVPPSAPVSLPQAHSSTPQVLAPQSQLQYLPTSSFDATQLDSSTQRKRGRPRKYFDEESKRAADSERRRKKKKGENDVDDSTDDGGLEANGTPSGTGKKEERRPYLHYQMDFGKYDNTKPGSLTARDIVVNWLAKGTNFKDWLSWTTDKKNEIAHELREEFKEHGMLDREDISVKQQITFLMRGCEEAKKYEKEKMDEPLTTTNSTKVSYLTNRGLPPGEAYIEHTWPFYSKLKDAAAEVSVPMPVTRAPKPPRPVAQPQSRPAHLSSSFVTSIGLDSMDYSALDGNLDPALGGTISGEPLQAEVLAVTSWANHLLSEESRRRQTSSKFSLPDMEDEEMIKVLREKEKWELEKMQIRQKLELEKEQMKIKDKNSERDTHVQSILVFRDLLKDGLTKNQAGRIVWRDQWPAIKASMDADED
ncbi:hypothetical protein QFC22_000042 [Naganishia vaughanmartiniae]|uniref:Uncharacterized protein n=1 Tax=Naganishia vaughanmartiniae TaxID=1424756 RepID=A0ACC2XNR6_9TREE|nr:hypothetical protein QFC22_000042 [Naganishia vaughanmartiniae]